MAKKRKLRKESTSDLGLLMGLAHIFASLCVTRSSPFSVALWLISLLAVFVRCAMKGNDDRIMGFPGLAVLIGILMPMRAVSRYVDAAVPFVWGLPIAAVLAVLCSLSVWRKERREKPLVKAVICLVFSIMLAFLAPLPMRLINTAFDGSTPQKMTATVANLYKSSGGRGTTIKHVVVDVPGEDGTADFTVPYQAYNAITVGDEVTVTRHDGFLGAPWWEMEPMAE